MIALGFGVAWAGYTAFMWGYCLVRDYNVTVPDLFKSLWPGVVPAHTAASQARAGTTGTSQAPGTGTAGGRG